MGSGGRRPEGFPILFAELVLVELSVVMARGSSGNEIDRLRTLEVRDALAAEGQQLGRERGVGVAFGYELDHGLDLLAPLFVR
jgi:hypothetical protein